MVDDVYVPPGWEVTPPKTTRLVPESAEEERSRQQQQQEDRCHEVKMEPESMDTDSEDGGVKLEPDMMLQDQSSNQVADSLSLPQLSDLVRMEQLPSRYFLWQMPADTESIKQMELKRRFSNMPFALCYYKSCRIIRHRWHIAPEECIPPSLRTKTLYSLALLVKLRRLASITKNNYLLADNLLVDAWTERSRTLGTGAPAQQLVERVTNDPCPCEPVIQECVLGLTCGDIDQAILWAKREKKRDKAHEKVQETRMRTRSRAKDEFRRNHPLIKAEPHGDDTRMPVQNKEWLKGMPIVAPQLPDSTRRSVSAQLVTERRREEKARKPTPTKTEQPNTGFTFTLPIRPSGRPAPPNPEEAKHPLQRMYEARQLKKQQKARQQELNEQRERDNILSNELGRMDMVHDGEMVRRAEECRQGVAMPSERFDFNTVRTLHPTNMPTQEDFARMGQGEMHAG
ncbi:uncharacterized protein LTR77_004263 [Saxophila tyrrhenica]|uniref:Uncharacterized protein n=1 Tax=Saxophila tyrrhenica TaxID=1690608 RepID=A0AAV9PCG7_9PEZI|nr:hypothetical protein LTR77_004263 [Saxophila tyrrhenica]